jgi:hypothetical protein
MATALFSFKIDNDKVSVLHVFFGEDDAKAEANLKAHADVCPKFGPAYRGGKTVQIETEITELPPADPDELAEWLDDEFNFDGDDETDEGDDAGEEEEDDEEEDDEK